MHRHGALLDVRTAQSHSAFWKQRKTSSVKLAAVWPRTRRQVTRRVSIWTSACQRADGRLLTLSHVWRVDPLRTNDLNVNRMILNRQYGRIVQNVACRKQIPKKNYIINTIAWLSYRFCLISLMSCRNTWVYTLTILHTASTAMEIFF